ncbi:hypothetical protein P3T73_08980 [Kiritimatiellota bacterium B12222]|nr:hypothetical protein P3T73_08980 [Kiritimatiellota bacterium B12222]
MSTLPTPKKHKLLKSFLLFLLLLIVLGVIAVQPFFIQAVLLPQVGKMTDSRIEVENLSLSLFSKLSAENVVYQPHDGSLEVTVEAVHVHYDLIKIIKGQIWVDELNLTRPVIQVTSLNSTDEVPEEPSADTNAKPLNLHIQNVSVVDGSITLPLSDRHLTIQALTFDLPQFISGQALHPTITAEIIAYAIENPQEVFMQGTLSADMELSLNADMMPTAITGGIEALLGENQAGVPPMKVAVDVDLSVELDQGTLHANKLTVNAYQNEKTLLEVSLSKPTLVDWTQQPPAFTDSELIVKLPPVDLTSLPFAELLPINAGIVHVNSIVNINANGQEITGALQAGVENLVMPPQAEQGALMVSSLQTTAKFTWHATESLQIQMDASSSGIQLPDSRKLPSPLTLQLKGNATPSQLELETFALSWLDNPSKQNRIQATGRIHWQNLDAMILELDIQGNELNLNPWSAFIEVSTASPADASTKPSQVPPEVTPAENTISLQKLTDITLPLDHAQITVGIDHILYKDIQLDTLAFKAYAEGKQVTISPMEVTINGSRLASSVDAHWANDLFSLILNSEVTPLDLAPIVDSFMPDKIGAVTGIVQGNTAFTIEGDSVLDLWQSFKGNINFSYTDGKIRLLDSDPEQHTALLQTKALVTKLVTALADALSLPPEQLMAPEIQSVTFKSEISDQRLSLTDASVKNTEFLLEVSGDIALNQEIGLSKIQDLPVVLGLSTNLAKRVKIYREERLRDDYVVLPSFIKVEGTLAEPKITVRKSVITGLILSGVTERNEIGNDNVQAGLDLLGTLLTGEAPPAKRSPTASTSEPIEETNPQSTPTPSPTPTKNEKKVEAISEGLRLFQQFRATPTPVPK